MIRVVFFLILLTVQLPSRSQELFIHNEPASTMPKNTLGVRVFSEWYKEISVYKNMYAVRLMYGVTPKLTVFVTGMATNHHDTILPPNFSSHEHSGSQTTFNTGPQVTGVKYPLRINGAHLFAKYRFYTSDGLNTHLRLASYAEVSYLETAHDESEPNLFDDTKGFGCGLISTYLKNHFAVSLTSGLLLPFRYKGYMKDPFGGVFPNTPTEIKYGNALKYNLSFGYLIFPRNYHNYNQLNVNMYLELMGKAYSGAKIYQSDKDGSYEIIPTSSALKAGNYIEAHPGIQLIVRSNLRLDFSVGFPVINRSLARFYPLYMVGIQRYFY